MKRERGVESPTVGVKVSLSTLHSLYPHPPPEVTGQLQTSPVPVRTPSPPTPGPSCGARAHLYFPLTKEKGHSTWKGIFASQRCVTFLRVQNE